MKISTDQSFMVTFTTTVNIMPSDLAILRHLPNSAGAMYLSKQYHMPLKDGLQVMQSLNN